MDVSDSLEGARRRRFPFFALPTITSEPVVAQRPDFDSASPHRPLYLPTSSKKCARPEEESSNCTRTPVLIGSAYFRPPTAPTDTTNGFPDPENPHPKILSTLKFKLEVPQNDVRRSLQKTSKKCAKTGFQIGNSATAHPRSSATVPDDPAENFVDWIRPRIRPQTSLAPAIASFPPGTPKRPSTRLPLAKSRTWAALTPRMPTPVSSTA